MNYQGPWVDPGPMVDSNGFTSDQAYLDAAYIRKQGAGVTNLIFTPGSDPRSVINGADEGAMIQGQPNPYGTAYNVDFAKYPPSAETKAAVDSVLAYIKAQESTAEAQTEQQKKEAHHAKVQAQHHKKP